MKSLTQFKYSGILIAIGLLCCSGFAQKASSQKFEGTITYSIEADGETQELTYSMKSNKARVEIAVEQLGGNAIVLVDSESENMTILMEQLSMYMQIPIPRDQENIDNGGSEEFHLTGERKSIASVDCQQYIYTDEDGNETELWTPVEESYGNFLFPGMDGNNMGSLKQPNMPDITFFPFLLVSSGEGSSMRLEATSVDEKKLNDDLFTVPSNFREMDMSLFRN